MVNVRSPPPHLTPSPTCIVLAGLPELYALGLQAALESGGIGPVVLVDGEELSSVLSGIGPVLLVVEQAHAVRTRALALVVAPAAAERIVEVTSDDSLEGFITSVRRGAVGVLTTGAELDVAVEVIRSALVGCVVLPEHVARALIAPTEASLPPPVEPREREWLRQLGQGVTVAGLASSSAYSEREMYRLLSKLYARLGAPNRTGALLKAERWGLLDD